MSKCNKAQFDRALGLPLFSPVVHVQMAEPIRGDAAKYARLAQQANIKPE